MSSEATRTKAATTHASLRGQARVSSEHSVRVCGSSETHTGTTRRRLQRRPGQRRHGRAQPRRRRRGARHAWAEESSAERRGEELDSAAGGAHGHTAHARGRAHPLSAEALGRSVAVRVPGRANTPEHAHPAHDRGDTFARSTSAARRPSPLWLCALAPLPTYSSREHSRDRPRRAAELARLTAPRAHAGLSTLDTCQSRLISLNLTREMLGKPSLAHRVLSPRPRRVLSSAGLAVTVSCAKRHRGRRVSVSLTAPASRDRTKSSLLDTFWLVRSRPACTRLGPLLLFSSRFALYRA